MKQCLSENGMACQSNHCAAVGCAAAVLLAAIAAPVAADPVAEFYKGKTVSLIIASGEGGGYDINGRLMAEFLSRHIPGHPTVIVRNMPGASGMRGADYMYNVAPPDGTVISIPQPTLLLNKVVDPSARYEPQGYGWVGRLGELQTYGVVWHAAPVRSVEQAKRTKTVMAAAQGPGTGSNVMLALNRLVGTQFTLVRGYKSTSESSLAMERGEVHGISSVSWELLENKGWISSNNVRFLYVVGRNRNPKIPQVPTLGDLASSNIDRIVMNSIASASDVGRSLLAPPKVPDQRLAALRKAFQELVRDPDFIREAKRRNVTLEPLEGRDLQTIVNESMDLKPDVAERIRQTIRP
jgi:tripartite-type tricarboxylate transporter receptor subunit TctC